MHVYVLKDQHYSFTVIETIFDEVKDVLQCQPVGIPLPLTEHVDDYQAACPACNLTLTGKPDN